MTGKRLVVDVGGTNARFALADGSGQLSSEAGYRTADFASFAACLDAYLGSLGGEKPVCCAIAAAGPVADGRVTLTNAAWIVERAATSERLGGVPVVLVNDLQAVAIALPYLLPEDVTGLAGPPIARPEDRSMLAFNVGTGCGAATAVQIDGRWIAVPSEAGHMSLSVDGPNAAYIAAGAAVETVLSGRGVVVLYNTILAAGEGGRGLGALGPEEAAVVFRRRADKDPAAMKAVEMFASVLGRIAGDLVLATAAWGGVYLVGSVASSWAAMVDDKDGFRQAFEAKGAMSERMRGVPVAVIRNSDVALFGLSKTELTDAEARR